MLGSTSVARLNSIVRALGSRATIATTITTNLQPGSFVGSVGARSLTTTGPAGSGALSSLDGGKPFLFYTAGTPNGRKVAILLEELKAAYGLEYE